MIISQNIGLYDICVQSYIISYMILYLTRLQAQQGNHFDKYFD